MIFKKQKKDGQEICNNDVYEPKDDNYVLVPVVKVKLKANLSIGTGYSLVDEAIKNYLRFFVDDTTIALADVVLSIVKYTPEVESYNNYTLNNWLYWVGARNWGLIDWIVHVDGVPLPMPYSGLVEFIESFFPNME